MSKSEMAHSVDDWFAKRGWKVFSFQRAVWKAAVKGESGLLHANTGAGKTYAVWFAALLRGALVKQRKAAGLRVLWITPMRALAADTQRALEESSRDLAPGWTIGARTGDTGSAERARQSKGLPSALITTPESLSLMLSHAAAAQQFAHLDMVIIDEWHELLGSKRGVQVQLALARLRHWRPELVVWGLSATMGNLAQAQDVLLGVGKGVLVEGDTRKEILVDSLIPPNVSRFPWGGHLGIAMLDPVIREIEAYNATLVFTNTRSQSELWYQNILEARPDWAGVIALHHGSLDREVREWVELGLKKGELKAVICTASLDLGVDFLPVERVLQIGSAKGIARLLQRAGRSGHAPGRVSRVTLVPTHSLEILEAAGAKQAVASRQIEARLVPNKPFDVLVQHLVTVALGGGFDSQTLFNEVKGAWSYRHLEWEEWQWALDFVARGGQSLIAYPEYQRVVPDEAGVYRVPNIALGRRHRMGIGTIVSDSSMQVKYMSGGRIGSVEESFISRLKPGDHFLFGGRILEFVRVNEMTAWVKRATGARGAVTRWMGAKMPMSSELAHAALAQLRLAREGKFIGPEMEAIRPLLEIQQRWSALPTTDTLAVESMKSREGYHLFMYPFAGRSVHMGLASLFAYRIGRTQPITFSIAINDYGFELLAAEPVDWKTVFKGKSGAQVELFSTERLLEDVLESLNATQLSQQRFREVARIAGLVFQGYPGQPKSARQIQASSSLFFEVFRKHDAGNLLLTQAQREVMEQELELTRLRDTLTELHQRRVTHCEVARATPFGFALMVERFREKLTTEKLSDRVSRMLRELEKGGHALSAREIDLAGERVLLLAQKAMYWPQARMLIIADIHFGKAASFRSQGVPVPRGTTSQNLAALDELMAIYPTREIVFLGDFLHARAAHASATVAAMLAWRQRNSTVRLTLVRGNHDVRAGDPSETLGISMVDEPHTVGPFSFCHHPDIAADGYVLAGHVHPVYILSSRLDSLRLPCFLVGPTRMVLPSFGAFTGGYVITPEANEQVYVTSGEAMHCVR